MSPDQIICPETIRVDAIILHVERTINHWKELKNKPSIVHRDKLMRELREIQKLSSQQIIQTQ